MKDGKFWRCCLLTCVAKAITVEDKLEAVRGEHNHAPNSAKNKAEKVVATMRELEKRWRLFQPYTWMLYKELLLMKTVKLLQFTCQLSHQ